MICDSLPPELWISLISIKVLLLIVITQLVQAAKRSRRRM